MFKWPLPILKQPIKRNLLYHITPLKQWNRQHEINGAWRWNVEQLRKRIDLFNGKRFVAICKGGAGRYQCEDPTIVMRELEGMDFHAYYILDNAPKLGHTVSWHEMMAWLRNHTIHDLNENITFYAHAKGVTRNVPHNLPFRLWTQTMYETCLDYYPLAEKQLNSLVATGSFLRTSAFNWPLTPYRWHYSGTFYWFRNDVVFRDSEWFNNMPKENAWAIEAWPGQWPRELCGCLFHSGDHRMRAARERHWRKVAIRQYEKWREENDRYKISDYKNLS